MANVKISGLPAASAVVGTNEFEINEAGTSKKVTGSQIAAFTNSTAGTVTSVGITSGGSISVSGSPVTGSGSITVGVSDGDKGGITVSGGGTVWQVNYGTITPDRMSTGAPFWDSAGNFGIGTSSLYVDTNSIYMTIDTPSTAGQAGINFRNAGNVKGYLFADSNQLTLEGSGILKIWTSNASLVFGTNYTERLRITSDGSVLKQGAGVTGYGSDTGGTVTQATNKSTGVTLNKASGEITLNGAALSAGTIVSFTLTNSEISNKDVMILNHVSTGTRGAYSLNSDCASGSATITIRNNTAGSLSEAIVIRFVLIKGSTT